MTRTSSAEGYAPLPTAGPAVHTEVTTGQGNLVMSFQVRPQGGLPRGAAGTYIVTLSNDGTRYFLTGPTKVANCSWGTELAFLPRGNRFVTYQVSEDPTGKSQTYLCGLP